MITSHDKELEFVLKYYQKGKLDTMKAYHKVMGKKESHYSLFVRIASVAAFVAVVLTSIGLYFYSTQPHWVELASQSEIKEYVLPDSSHITLAPYSVLRYDKRSFAREKRIVEMSGKAYFNVHHDESLPFIVNSKWARVQVLGTRFQVADEIDEVSVFVESGKVLFSNYEKVDLGCTLTKGMNAILQKRCKSPSMLKPLTSNQQAWRTGELVYDATPINVVLEELSRFYNVRLSSDIDDKLLTARFSTDDLNAIISNIELALNIHIYKQ